MARVLWNLVTAALALTGPTPEPQSAADRASPDAAPTPSIWYCLLHPEVRSDRPGICPKGGDPLFPGDPWEQRDYPVVLSTRPDAPRTGDSFTLRIDVQDPETRETVMDFTPVLGERLHLFVISQDQSAFAHLHPEQQLDGSWKVVLAFPRPGYYRIFGEHAPVGGPPQTFARTLATAGWEGDLQEPGAMPAPSTTRSMRAGHTDVRLEIEPAVVEAGLTVRLRYLFEAGGEPVEDLEPFETSWGHAVALRGEGDEYVRVHALDYIPVDAIDPRGGPELRFDATFPRAGHYRVWLDFKHRAAVSTVAFDVEVLPRATDR